MTLGIALGALRRAFAAVVGSLDRFIEGEAYRLAASLSFYALSSLLPLLLVALGVADALLGDSATFRQTLISMFDVTDSPTLRELILEALQSARGGSERSSWSIVLGLFGAALGASGIFLELDAAMEKLFRVAPVRRSPLGHVRRFLLDRGVALLLVIATSLLLLFGAVVLSSLELLATRLRIPSDAWPGALTYTATLALLTGALTLCYRVLPQPNVRLGAAFAGAAFATLGLTIARLPLTWGIAHLTSYATYGVVGALLVLVTWFYVAGCILLLGAALTARVNELRGHASAEDQRDYGQDQEHDEQDLGDARGASGDAAKAKDRSQKRNHEKNGSPVQHDVSSDSR